AVRTVAGAIQFPVDVGDRAGRKRIGDRLADEVGLVTVKDRAGCSKGCLIVEIGEAEFGGAVEHRADRADAVAEWPKIRRVGPVEMLLDIEAETRKARAERRVDVAPVGREQFMRHAVTTTDRGIDVVTDRLVAGRVVLRRHTESSDASVLSSVNL